MRILVVLLVAALCTVAGGFIGGSMTDTTMPLPAGQTLTQAEEMRQSMRHMSAGIEIHRKRQKNMMIGGGIGLVVGAGVGALVASRMKGRANA